MSRPPQKIEGIVFPPNDKGERSSTDINKLVFAAAASATDPELGKQILAEKNWRYRYNKWVLKLVQENLKTPEGALKAAEQGLDALYKNMEFVRDGNTWKFGEAMQQIKGTFHTGVIKGKKSRPDSFDLGVPYKGKELRGEALIKQLKKWADYGTIEPSTAEAIASVANNSKWLDLSDKYFVLLGAGSAMGPFLALVALGANIIALDIDRPNVWKRLISIVEDSSATITFPLKKPQSEIKDNDDLYANAGANLITQAPEVLNWLKDQHKDKPLVVGCYVYLDGEAHVRVALACDAIMKGITESRKGTTLAFLCTPTDIHVIPDEARRASEANYSSLSLSNLLVLPVKLLGGGKYLAKNALPPVKTKDGKEISIVDGLSVVQGPNYALAKRMQHWRAIIARASGSAVSSHIAPSTTTVSVIHNRSIKWAYDGMPYFPPMEIFDQETSNAVMAALLIHDIRNPQAVANPSVKLDNPYELFKHYGFHGGMWRVGYKVDTIGEVSVLIHFIKVLRPLIFVLVLAVAYFFYQRLNI